MWFEGIKPGQTLNFNTSSGKPHQMLLLSIDPVNESGVATVRYVLDSEILTSDVQIDAPVTAAGGGGESVIAESGNPYHVASRARLISGSFMSRKAISSSRDRNFSMFPS